jgi:hypothetical protein
MSQVGPPPPEESSEPRASFVGAIGPLAAVLFAFFAIVAGYAASQHGRTARTNSAPLPRASAVFDTAYPPELGPLGQYWRWMGSKGRVLTRGTDRYYLAFRALSVRGRRRITFGTAGSVTVDERPRPFVVGRIVAGVSTPVAVAPGAQRASTRDPRLVSVFLSGPRLFASPVAALPGDGFYPDETMPDGTVFNWLRDRGVIEVVSADPANSRVWLTMSARSPIRRRLTATIAGARQATLVELRAGRVTSVTLGPIRLRASRGRIELRVTPGPRPEARDRRPIGAQIGRLEAALTAPHLP